MKIRQIQAATIVISSLVLMGPARANDELPAGAELRLGSGKLRHAGPAKALAFSQKAGLIATPGTSGVRLWDAKTGGLVRELGGYSGFGIINSMAFSPDGKYLALGTDNRTVVVWDVQSKEQRHTLATYLSGAGGAVYGNQVAFTPDGSQLIGGCLGGVLHVWDVETGKELKQIETRDGADDYAWTIAVSPDGNTLAVGYKSIRLFDLKSGKLIRKIDADLRSALDVHFTPDGRYLICRGWTNTDSIACHLYDLKEDKVVRVFDGAQGTTAVAVSPDGRWLAGAGYPQTALWEIATGKKVRTMLGTNGNTWSVAFGPDGKTLASRAKNGIIPVWETATGQELHPTSEGTGGAVTALKVMPDGATVLAGTTSQVQVWDLTTGHIRRGFLVSGDHSSQPAFSPDGSLVVLGHGSAVHLWDVATGQKLWAKADMKKAEPELEFESPLTEEVKFLDQGRMVISFTEDAKDTWRKNTLVRVWDTETGQLIAQVNRRRRFAACYPSFDGKVTTIFESFQSEQRIGDRAFPNQSGYGFCVIDTTTGQVVEEQVTEWSPGQSFAYSPDGQFLAFGNFGDYVEFRSAKNLELLFSLRGRRSGVMLKPVLFSPDGKHLAAASNFRDGEIIQVWEVATGRMLHEFQLSASSLAFTPDGRRLLAGQDDGTILVWDLTSPTASRKESKLTPEELEERWKRYCSSPRILGSNREAYERKDALVEGGDEMVDFLGSILLGPERKNLDDSRTYEVVEVLAQIGTKRARQLLQKLSQGPEDTREAKNLKLASKYTLERLDKLKLRSPE